MICLKNFPKVELHVHLDGSVRIKTIAELAKRSLPEIQELMEAPRNCENLNDYLTKFSLPVAMLQTKETLKRVAYELGCDLKEDGVCYAEVRFAPMKHLEKGLTKEEVVEAVLEGFHAVSQIELRLLLCMMRDQPVSVNQQVITLAKQYQAHGVVGVDLAGAEALYPTKNFSSLFQLAKQEGVPFTIHAGEAAGVESILAALSFGTTRIGHGVRAVDSKDVIQKLKEANVLLEICPTSNLQTGIVKTYEDHPFRKLLQKGCRVMINTDNRTVSNTTLTTEYERMLEAKQLTIDELFRSNIQAMEASFAEETTKKKVIEEILVYKQQFWDK